MKYGLAQGTQIDFSLFEDPTWNSPYDDLSQVYFKTVTVPPGAQSLVAMTESDEAPDVDLLVGTGSVPSAGTQVCVSWTLTASEICEIASPVPAPGGFWFRTGSGSMNQPDLISLFDAVDVEFGSRQHGDHRACRGPGR